MLSSATTGTWSEGLSQLRVSLVDMAGHEPVGGLGDSSKWSMRMPLFFWKAPA